MIAVTMKSPCIASTNARVWVCWLTAYIPAISPAGPGAERGHGRVR